MPETIFSALEEDMTCIRKQTVLPRFPKVTFHNHDGYEIFLFLNGDANYYVESNGKLLERGDVILTVPYAFHSADARPDKPYDRVIINVKEPYLNRFQDASCNLADCFYRLPADRMNLIRLDEDEILQFTDLAKSLEQAQNGNAYGQSLLVPAIFTQLLVFLNQKVPVGDVAASFPGTLSPLVKSSIEYINAHFTEDIHIKDFEKICHHNKDYVCRCFKAATGLSIGQFILEKRLSLAKTCSQKACIPAT